MFVGGLFGWYRTVFFMESLVRPTVTVACSIKEKMNESTVRRTVLSFPAVRGCRRGVRVFEQAGKESVFSISLYNYGTSTSTVLGRSRPYSTTSKKAMHAGAARNKWGQKHMTPLKRKKVDFFPPFYDLNVQYSTLRELLYGQNECLLLSRP